MRRKAYEEYCEKQRKYYDSEFEFYVQVLAEKKRIANLKATLPENERWKANTGLGGHAHYD